MQLVDTYEVISGSKNSIVVKVFAQADYSGAFDAMLDFTNTRDQSDVDQIWLIQHSPVYTQGTACQQTTLLPSNIPVVKADRGGQITYHGPGQIVMYPLLSLRRFGIGGNPLGVKMLVNRLEQCVIDCLTDYSVKAQRREDAPGVYVGQAKIAALGLRIRRGCSYHGLSCNVDMDLTPFSNIDPCGFQGLKVTQLKHETSLDCEVYAVGKQLLDKFVLSV